MRYLPSLLILLLALESAAHPLSHHQLQRLDERMAQDPNSQYLTIQRGITLMDDLQYDEALTQFRLAEQLGDPLDVATPFGILYYRRGDFETAQSYFDRFLEHHPDDLQALEYRARLLRDAGNIQASLQDYKHFLAIAPNPDPARYLSAAKLALELPDQGVVAALQILDEGIEKLGPASPLIRFAADLELSSGEVAKAIARLEQLPANVRNTPDWKAELAHLHYQNQEPERAYQLLEEARTQLLTLKPTAARQRLARDIEQLLDTIERNTGDVVQTR